MFRDKTIPTIYGAMVFLLSACATAANGGMGDRDEAKGIEQFEGDPRLGKQVDRMCFTSDIDSFSANTDDTVVLEASPNRHYLVETSACFTLDRAQSIAVSSKQSCASKGDYLLVSDSAFGLENSTGMGPDRCFIKSIYEWDDDAPETAVDQ